MVSSQGPNDGSTFVDDASYGSAFPWTNPANAAASDNVYAVADNSYSDGSHYLKATGFGFSIPQGSQIVGIVVGVERKAVSGTSVHDGSVRLVIGNVVTGSDYAATGTAWPTSDAYASYGGAGDLWGCTLTAALVNASDFGVVIAAHEYPNNGVDAHIDHIRITVYYNLQGDPEATIPPSSPYMPLFSSPWFQAYTYNTTFSDILDFQVRLGANGAMGAFQFTIPDPIGIQFSKVARNDRCVMLLRQGPVERRYTGVIETCTRPDTGRTIPRLRIRGRGYAVYLARRNKAVDYATRSIYDIITNTSDGIASGISEIDFVNYVRSPALSISTSARKRSCFNVLEELMVRSGSAMVPWTFYVCHQQHIYEANEALHFLEKTYAPSPVVISSDEVLRSERISTMEFLRNQIEVEYGSAGATETRNDTTSQTSYGIIYDYTYAPFLAAAASAQDWGDKSLYRVAAEMKAVSLTIPMNLFIEPNYTLRYRDAMTDQIYEVGMVMHQGSSEGFECQTVVEIATTLS
jgi:hypothetical protein